MHLLCNLGIHRWKGLHCIWCGCSGMIHYYGALNPGDGFDTHHKIRAVDARNLPVNVPIMLFFIADISLVLALCILFPNGILTS